MRTHSHGVVWTDAENADLTRMWLEGLSCSAIARQLYDLGYPPRTRNAVIGRVHRMGLAERANPTRPRVQNAANRKAIAEGMKRYHAANGHRTQTAREKQVRRERSEQARQYFASVALKPDTTESLMLPLDALRPWQCRAVSDMSEWGRALYCGRHTDGGSWCAHHRARFFDTRATQRSAAKIGL